MNNDIEWKMVKLGDVLKIGNGRDYKHLNSGDIPVYGTGGYMCSVNDYLYDGDTVCIGRKGTIDVPQFHSGKIWTVDTLFYTHSFTGVVPKFIFYAFCLIDWKSKNEATGVPSLSKGIIEKVKIPIPYKNGTPDIETQSLIAQKLSDMDSLISAKEKLLAKKRNLKTAAMQKLIKDEESENWKKVKLGEEAIIIRGGSPRPIEDYITDSPDGINWVKIGDVAVGAKYIEHTEEKIISEGMHKSRAVKAGDFLLSNSMSFGRPYILKIDGAIHDGWLAIQKYSKTFDTDYLYYVLSSDVVLNQYLSMAAGSSVLNLNKQIVAKVMIPIPCNTDKSLDLTEQKRIATILSDMDSEITSIEKEISKLQNLKTAMMQKMFCFEEEDE